MQPLTTQGSRSARFVGGPISKDYFKMLTDGYKSVHPGEQSTVFISKEFILETLRQLPDISGLRFIYGINQGAEPSSRTIVIVPCNDSSADKPIPNLLFLRNGYLTSDGQRLQSAQCWELFTRYVDRMQQLLPDARRNDIPRACFFGIHILEQMLTDENCAGIVYHFGYDPDKDPLALRYQAALVAVDPFMIPFDPPVDTSNPCPPAICFMDPAMSSFSLLLQALDSPALTEMYQYASPSLIEAFQRSGMTANEYYGRFETQFATCRPLLAAGRREEAKIIFQQRLETLIAEFLH